VNPQSGMHRRLGETTRVRSVNTVLKHRYQIIVLCRAGDCAMVEQIVREQLDAGNLTIDDIRHPAEGHQRLARVVARVCCTISERSTLVGLVSRLELEPAIRSVRWKSLSERESI
jgi:uncharacterized membrane protein YhiD involved in acid resistance